MTARQAKWQGMNWIRQEKRLAIYHRDGFACVYCGEGADEGGAGLSLDHVLAHELGGTNEATNLATACPTCNSAKAHRTMRAWLAYLRDRGVNTDGLAARIRRQTSRALDITEGKRLVAARMGDVQEAT